MGEVRTEAVASDVFHFVLVGQRGNGTLWILARELFVEEDEIGEAAADFTGGFGKRLEVGLQGPRLAIAQLLSRTIILGDHAEPKRTFVVTR